VKYRATSGVHGWISPTGTDVRPFRCEPAR
jgi:hypothetical protein